jgi:hypothetical protein
VTGFSAKKFTGRLRNSCHKVGLAGQSSMRGNMVEAERIPGHNVGVLNGPIGPSSALAILPGPYLLDRRKAG